MLILTVGAAPIWGLKKRNIFPVEKKSMVEERVNSLFVSILVVLLHKTKIKYKIRNQNSSSPFSLCHKVEVILPTGREFSHESKSWTKKT